MKTELFSNAISRRNRVRFLYLMNEVILDPYYLGREKNGKKVIYGRVLNSTAIKKFEYKRIVNLKIINEVIFSPIIPLMSKVS